ncbi:hypothetical protein [Acetobacter indonesiensis]|uniref:hypothetical protein n=1 Tax=Acetobacter indonesiensis TaxID=104101 RepID=UPI000B00CBFE|nr:hypothetical protein [Acetobacter indonesiensis]
MTNRPFLLFSGVSVSQKKRPPGMLLGLGLAVLSTPFLTGCHREIEGDNIDLPYERPGRFMPEAAPAEARRAKEQEEREDRARTAGQLPEEKPQKPEDRYEMLTPSNATNGPLQSDDGHSIIPETEAIYGKPGQQQPQKPQ